MPQALFFHPESNGINGIRTIELKTCFFIVLDKLREEFKTVAIGGCRRRIIGGKPIYLGEVDLILLFSLDDFWFEHHKYQFIRFV